MKTRLEQLIYLSLMLVLVIACCYQLVLTSNAGDTWRGALFPAMIEGTAQRPYVTRTLMPLAMNLVNIITPSSFIDQFNQTAQQWIVESEGTILATTHSRPLLRALANPDWLYLRWAWVLLSAICLILYATLSMRIYAHLWGGHVVFHHFISLAALALVFVIPTKVMYLYDPSVLALSAACYYAIVTKKWHGYYLLLVLASINKESAILIIFFFAVFHESSMRPSILIRHLTMQLILWAVIRLTIFGVFIDNPDLTLPTGYWKVDHHSFLIISTISFILALWMFKFGYHYSSFVRASVATTVAMILAYILFGKVGEYRVFYDVAALMSLMLARILVMLTQNMFNFRR